MAPSSFHRCTSSWRFVTMCVQRKSHPQRRGSLRSFHLFCTLSLYRAPGNIIRRGEGVSRGGLIGGVRATARAKVNRGIITRHAPSLVSQPSIVVRARARGGGSCKYGSGPTANNNSDSCLLLRASICSEINRGAAYRQAARNAAARAPQTHQTGFR